jgi:gliding motility-associated-like protein
MKLTGLFFLLFLSISVFSQNSRKAHQHSETKHHFIENKGQWDSEVLFKTSFRGGNLWIQKSKLFFHLKDFAALRENHGGKSCDTCINRQHALHVNFKNCNPVTQIEKFNPSLEYYNFFLGDQSKQWTNEVRAYNQLSIKELYQGIDLRFIQEDEITKYEFVISPKADPKQITLEIAGATQITTGTTGELILKTPLGIIQENKPYAYQIIENKTHQIACEFVIQDSTVIYKLGKYNPNFELIIDPVLVFATYSGSVTDNFGMTATYGHDGTAYSGGTIFGNNYPTPDKGVYNTKSNFTLTNGNNIASDIFISKYSADGSQMIWTNFIGGGSNYNGAETVHSLICDKDNNLYAFGATASTNFPTTNNCVQNTHRGGSRFNAVQNGALFGNNGVDIVTFQLSSDGKNLNASTYIGGSGNDGVNTNLYGIGSDYNNESHYDSLTVNYGDQFRGEIMLDSLKNVYIATSTRSLDFPLVNPIFNTINGQQDGVVIKLTNNLSSILFSTYLGGSNNDALYSIKLDSLYNIVFCGGTSSSNLPTTSNVYQSNFGGGKADGWIGKINQKNNSLLALTYLGLDSYDQCYIVETDETNDVYVVGHSLGGNFPIINATYKNANSSQIIVKLDPVLSKIKQSTTYGSGNNSKRDISPAAMLVDSCKNVYISGWGANVIQNTELLNGMPTTSDAVSKTSPNGFDFHLFAIDRDFSKILYGSYLGGSSAAEHVDGGTSRFDRSGIIYQSICGGCGGFSDFPTTSNAWSQTNRSYNCNNIVLKFDFQLKTTPIINSIDSICYNNEFKLENKSTSAESFYWKFDDGSPNSTDTIIYKKFATLGKHEVELVLKNKYCSDFKSIKKKIEVVDNTINLIKIPQIELCKTDTATFYLNSSYNSNKIFWSYDKNFQTIKNQDTIAFSDVFSANKKVYYKVADSYCYKIDSTGVVFLSPSFQLQGKTTVCTDQASEITVSISPISKKYTSTWFGNDVYNQTSPTTISITPKNNASYYGIRLVTEDSCIVNDSILIKKEDPKYSSIQLTSQNDSIFKGETNKFEAFPGSLTYEWLNVENGLSKTENPLFAKPDTSRFYHVIGNDGVCLYYDSIFIKVIKDWECDFPYIFVPNAFSPNGDNENDILYVRGRPMYEIEFRVFNRWGENVFTSFNLDNGWDGTYKGQKLAPDVYDYYLKVNCINGVKKQFQGNVTLLK